MSDPRTALGWAKRYDALDWTIIPAGHGKGGKRPPGGFLWKQYQTERPTGADLERWFRGNGSVPAVILGSASGGLVCRDFDDRDAYHAWTVDHPDLAQSLPTVETGRGFHVYMRSAAEIYRTFDDGEIRGDSCHYAILPPAVHRNGKSYVWIVNLPTSANAIPLIDPFAEGLAHVSEGPEGRYRGNRTTCVPSGTSVPSVSSVSLDSLSEGDRNSVLRAIGTTLPERQGQRNAQIFQLARKLRGIPSLAGRNGPDLREIVRSWHTRALPNIRTQEFVDTYGDFLRAWTDVRKPANEEFMGDIIERARANPMATGHDEAQDILAAMCRELQQAVGEGPFYLSTRDAAAPFGQTAAWGSRRLAVLEAEGIIECVERGSPQTQRATRFRYVGPETGAHRGNQR